MTQRTSQSSDIPADDLPAPANKYCHLQIKGSVATAMCSLQKTENTWFSSVRLGLGISRPKDNSFSNRLKKHPLKFITERSLYFQSDF